MCRADVIERLERARAVVDRAATGDEPIYGLNSALGANTGAPLAPEEQQRYQTAAVRARAVGIGRSIAGRPRPGRDVRARGGHGARRLGSFRCRIPRARRRLESRDSVPCVPAWGSIGVADLPQMSHIALALIGEGEAHVDGKRVAGAQALAAAGLAPVVLAAKDGLALISSNAVTVGHACLVLTDLARTLDAARRSDCAVVRRISREPVAVRSRRRRTRGRRRARPRRPRG